MNRVIDTNVAIAANGRNTHASDSCQYRCIELLEEICNKSSKYRIFLDSNGLIFEEYSRHLNFHGQPGVGDIFFKYTHDHLYTAGKVVQVTITNDEDDSKGFAELPPNSIDPSDRKFLAVAVAGNAKIVNALDSDWYQQRSFVHTLGVKILEICPEHVCGNTK